MQGFVIASPSDRPFFSTTVFMIGPQTTLASGLRPALVAGMWMATEPSRTVQSPRSAALSSARTAPLSRPCSGVAPAIA